MSKMARCTYPLVFEPALRSYVWGGRRLEELYGRVLPPGVTAESWEISGHPIAPTRVLLGCWRGRRLPELLAEMGEQLVGSNSAATLRRGRFPLLVKLLDARQDLSVQVHPDDAYALTHEDGELGKTELWYILHAGPGTELIHGLEPGTTEAMLRAAIRTNALAPRLRRIPVQAGDALFIPAGTVHALLAGAVVAEIQQNSDATYRLHDWGRQGVDGRPRPLHVDKALEVIDFGPHLAGVSVPRRLCVADGVTRELLVTCPQFIVERLSLTSGAVFTGACDGSTFEIWGCVSGEARVEWAGQGLPLPAVRFTLLPAALGAFALRSVGPSVLLRAFVGHGS